MSKVSIIIPCYNGERTIKRCIESALNQTYQNLEILFINDGSTDHSLEIAQNYSIHEERLRIFDMQINKGVSAARNFGLKMAKGEYVEFLDADDEMRPTMVETLLNALLTSGADIAVSNFSGNPLFFTTFTDRIYELEKESDRLEYYQDTFCMLLPWNKLYKRKSLTITFDEEVHFAEDELFNLSVLKEAKRIICVNQPLYVYHYAPAEESDMERVGEKSCLNKIIDSSNHNSKNSIWYMGNELLPKRRKILEEMLFEKQISNMDDYLYTRAFDFYFWELSAFAYMKVEKKLIIQETMQIFQEKDFIKSLEVQKKYGIKYLSYKKEKLESQVELLIDLCLACYEEIKSNSLDVNFYEIFLLLFMKLFCIECSRKSTKYNKLYELSQTLQNNETKEARYFNLFIEERQKDRIVV